MTQALKTKQRGTLDTQYTCSMCQKFERPGNLRLVPQFATPKLNAPNVMFACQPCFNTRHIKNTYYPTLQQCLKRGEVVIEK